MKRILLAAGAASLLMAVIGAGPARGDDVAVSATVLGSRSITTAAMTTAIPSALPGANADGVLAVTVTETTATGDAAWSVTAELCATSACSTRELVHGTDNTKKIAATAVSVLNRAVVQTSGGGTSAVASTTEDLSVARTLFSNSGQSTSLTYSGTYASTSTIRLAVPSGATVGTYSGVLKVTLVE